MSQPSEPSPNPPCNPRPSGRGPHTVAGSREATGTALATAVAAAAVAAAAVAAAAVAAAAVVPPLPLPPLPSQPPLPSGAPRACAWRYRYPELFPAARIEHKSFSLVTMGSFVLGREGAGSPPQPFNLRQSHQSHLHQSLHQSHHSLGGSLRAARTSRRAAAIAAAIAWFVGWLLACLLATSIAAAIDNGPAHSHDPQRRSTIQTIQQLAPPRATLLLGPPILVPGGRASPPPRSPPRSPTLPPSRPPPFALPHAAAAADALRRPLVPPPWPPHAATGPHYRASACDVAQERGRPIQPNVVKRDAGWERAWNGQLRRQLHRHDP